MRAIAGVAAALLLAACSDGDSDSGAGQVVSTLARAQQSGTIRVGYANEAPYAYLDAATGRLTGEAPEIARVILAELGIPKIEGVLTEFGSLIPGLNAGRFDMIAAGMYILPERCREVAFSNPTYSVGEAIIVRQGNAKRLHSYEDVAKHTDATLGVVAGTVERGYARATGIPDDRVVVFPDAVSALDGVIAERVDGYAGTSLTVNDLLRRAGTGRIERADPFADPVINGKSVRGYGAFALRKDDEALLAEFNRRLAAFIGSERHLKLVEPFGFGARELRQSHREGHAQDDGEDRHFNSA